MRPLRRHLAVLGGVTIVVAVAAAALYRRADRPAPSLVALAPSATSARPPTPDAALAPPVAVTFASGPNQLTGYLLLPEAASHAPLLVYNHGSEQDPGLQWLGEVGRFYQARGYVVFFPWRQGCSGSGGTYWSERFPMSGDPSDVAVREARNIQALTSELVDVLAAIEFGRTLPAVDPANVYVAGASFGGLLALMAAGSSSAVKGAIVCSGAAWTYDGDTPAGQQRIEKIAVSARAPVLFLEAANDYNPEAGEELRKAMVEAGRAAVSRVYPPYGKTVQAGHAAFCNHGMREWGDDVMTFLASTE